MNIQLEKYKLMEWLININDVSILNKLKQLKETVSEKETITEIEQTLIDAGIKDYEIGDTYSHKQVMNELKEKYGI